MNESNFHLFGNSIYKKDINTHSHNYKPGVRFIVNVPRLMFYINNPENMDAYSSRITIENKEDKSVML